MTQQQIDLDKTVFPGLEEQSAAKDLPASIRPVAVSPSSRRRDFLYIAQQTSLEDFTPGLNPLVNAAVPLLLTIVRLREDADIAGGAFLVAQGAARPKGGELNPSAVDIESLRTRLEAEMRGFESQALASGIEHSQAIAARYLLCTAVDEAITTSSVGASGDWSKLALLSTFHNETWGGEKFFQILDRCMQQPARNLYLLELMYLLLSLGFEGKFRVLDRGPIAIEAARDKIYRQVRLLRGEPSQDLSKKIEPGTARDKIYAYIPLWLICVIVVFCIAVTFIGFSTALESHADPILKKLAAASSEILGGRP